MSDPQSMIHAMLNDETVRLYHTSATFKAGVDHLVQWIIPATLIGLAAQAEQTDRDTAERIRIAEMGSISPEAAVEILRLRGDTG